MCEVEMLRRCSHPHILRLLSVCEDGPNLCLLLEFCAGPDLQRLLDLRGALLEDEAKRIFSQVCAALCHLRERRIVHRDVKPANVALKAALPDDRSSSLSRCITKLLDFGFARVIDVAVASPRARRWGKRRGDRSVHGIDSGSKHGGSNYGGSKHGGSNYGGSKHGGSECGSTHGGETTVELEMDGSLVFDGSTHSAAWRGDSPRLPEITRDCPRLGSTHSAAWRRTTYLPRSVPSSPTGRRTVGEVRMTPLGTRHWAEPRLQAAGLGGGVGADGRLVMSLDEVGRLPPRDHISPISPSYLDEVGRLPPRLAQLPWREAGPAPCGL